MKLFLSVLCLLLLTACGKKLTDSKRSVTEAYAVEDEFMSLVNAHRNSLNLKELIPNTIIARIAHGHSKNMAMRRLFGHTGWQRRCSEIQYELGQGDSCGENVAMGQNSAREVFKAWMSSPGHRAQIEGDFTHTGLGFSENSKGVRYWTQIFIKI